MLHRARHLFVRQQTSVINAIRAHLAEFGIVAPVGRHGVEELLDVVTDPNDKRVPDIARACLRHSGSTEKHQAADTGVRPVDQGLAPIQRDEHEARGSPRRRSGTGHRFGRRRCWSKVLPIRAQLLGLDRNGAETTLEWRQEQARQHKQGDRYLRGLFVAGALSVIRYAKIHGIKHRPWLTALLARRPTKVAAIALANKIARMVWAMMARGERYKEPVALARKRDRAGHPA
nr:hypothetical protein [Bradyrhizobium sp. AUGA SZCCT0158]